MTVIRPNSVSGITSITAQANEINFFRSNGTLAGLQLNGVNFNTTTGVSTFNNLDVGGVLTYQDVTNVDSLGIGTFRTGINVSGGQIDVGSNIKLGNAGVITATSFVGSGANLTSLPTQVTISSNADNRIITGGSGVNLTGESNFTYDGNEVAVYASTDDTDCVLHLVGKTASGGVGQAGRTAIIAESSNNSNGQSKMHFRTRNTSNAQLIAMTIDGNQNVGIGITNPNSTYKTHIKSSSFGLLRLETTLTGSDAPYLEFYHNSTSPADNDQLGIIQFKGKNTNADGSPNDDHTYAYMMVKSTDVSDGSEDGDILFATAGGGVTAERLRITSTGIVNAPSQAGFYARMNNTKSSVMGGGASYYTVPFDTDSGSICYDTHNSYNTGTGLYTVPTGGTGYYMLATAVCLSSNVGGRGGECWFVQGGNRYFFDRRFMTSTSGTITGFYGTSIIYLSAGQSIGVQGFISGGNQNVDVQGAGASDHITWFTARKIA